jgi:histidyl-tRNA synthetase
MESSTDVLQKEIDQQTLFFNDLRKQNAAPTLIDEAKKKLSDLKKSLALSKGTSSAKDAGGKKRERLMLKTAKVRLHLHHLQGIV